MPASWHGARSGAHIATSSQGTRSAPRPSRAARPNRRLYGLSLQTMVPNSGDTGHARPASTALGEVRTQRVRWTRTVAFRGLPTRTVLPGCAFVGQLREAIHVLYHGLRHGL